MGGIFSKKVGRKEILMLGLDNAGKTTTFLQLRSQLQLNAEDISTTPTIGCNQEQIHYRNIKMNVIDMGGRAEVCLVIGGVADCWFGVSGLFGDCMDMVVY